MIAFSLIGTRGDVSPQRQAVVSFLSITALRWAETVLVALPLSY